MIWYELPTDAVILFAFKLDFQFWAQMWNQNKTTKPKEILQIGHFSCKDWQEEQSWHDVIGQFSELKGRNPHL